MEPPAPSLIYGHETEMTKKRKFSKAFAISEVIFMIEINPT